MILLDFLRYILVFPFILLLVLKYLGFGEKQKYFIVFPVFFYTFIKLTALVFDDYITLLVGAGYIFWVLFVSTSQVKKQYRSLLPNFILRKFLYIFSKTFIFYWVVLCVVGIIRF